jgi:O-antigen/teichoic acid export membrane protein
MGLVRQSATTFASRILITVVNIPISILVARSLGVDGQGVYAAAMTFPTFWATVWILGIDAAHTWSLASKRTTLGHALGNTILWTVVLSVLAVPTYLFAAHFIDPSKVKDLIPVFAITAGIVPLILARYILLSSFLGLGQVDRYNLLNVVSQVVLLFLLIGVLIVAKGGTRGAVIAYGISVLVLVILAAAWLARQKRTEDPIRVDSGLAKASLSYGLRGYGATVFGQLNYRFDQVLVPLMAGITQQGYYSIAVLLAEKLSLITNSIQVVLFPKVSGSNTAEANRVTTAACRHALFWVGLSGAALFAISKPLIRIVYGKDFLPALTAMWWLIPGVFLLTFWKILTVDLSGRNRRASISVASGIAFVVNTGLNIWWIPRQGMLGAARSSLIAYAVQSLFVTIFFLRITGLPLSKLLIPERGDVELYRRAYRQLRARMRDRRRPAVAA